MRRLQLFALTGLLIIGVLGCNPKKDNLDELEYIQSTECCGEVGQIPSEPEEEDDD